MNEMMIKIKLYGILNRYHPSDVVLSLKVPKPCEWSHLVENLYQALTQTHPALLPEKMHELKQIILSSAFAKEDQMLAENSLSSQIQPNDFISVLPPVCGG